MSTDQPHANTKEHAMPADTTAPHAARHPATAAPITDDAPYSNRFLIKLHPADRARFDDIAAARRMATSTWARAVLLREVEENR